MTERIDRTARATLAQADAMLTVTEATLALVEQQRIANLLTIALGQRPDTGLSRAASDAAYTALVDEDEALRPDIAAALGIDTTEES